MNRKHRYRKIKEFNYQINLFKHRHISKFINNLMKNGNKTLAEKLFYDSMNIIYSKTKLNPMIIFFICINKVTPLVELKLIRLGGSTYRVPIELKPDKQINMGIKLITQSISERSESSLSIRIANEFIDILKNQSLALKKKEELHKTAESNRAFSHFRW